MFRTEHDEQTHQQQQQPERERKKIVIVGSGGCGKTSLLLMYSRGSWTERYIPTVFENHMATLSIKDRLIDLELWDTAGQEDYDRLRPLSYPGTDAVIICFSVSCRKSLQAVQDKWAPEVRHFCPPETPIILVGTKTDLREGSFDDYKCIKINNNKNDNRNDTGEIISQEIVTMHSPKQLKQETISMEEGLAVAKEIGANRYMECSAFKRKNINSIFETTVRTCWANKRSISCGGGGGGNVFGGVFGKIINKIRKAIGGDACSYCLF